MNAYCIRFCSAMAAIMMVGSLGAAPFDLLFRVLDPAGNCQVCKPGMSEFEPVLKGKAYPYGTVVRTGPASSATIILSSRDALKMSENTTLASVAGENPSERVLRLEQGRLTSSMDASNPSKSLTIETPVGYIDTISGNGKLTLQNSPEAFQLDAMAESGGQLVLSGPQFKVPSLKSGYSVRITTARDQSLTRIFNTLGDYTVEIDNGTEDLLPIETNTRSAIRIWRDRAPVGGRMIVSILATGPDGKGKDCFAFAVGQPAVASGTLLEDDEGVTNGVAGKFDGAILPRDKSKAEAIPTGIDALFD